MPAPRTNLQIYTRESVFQFCTVVSHVKEKALEQLKLGFVSLFSRMHFTYEN